MNFGVVLFIAVVCLVIGFITSRLLISLQDDVHEDAPKEDLDGVLKVWRDGANLRVEFGGRPFSKMIDLSTKERHTIQQILLQLNRWIDPEPVAKSNSGETDMALVDQPQTEQRSKPDYNPLMMLRNAIRADVPKVPPPDVNIVSQIDEILQEKLKSINRKGAPIRLLDMPGQGMVVLIGLEKFNEIDDVPHESIRNLIRSAVKEWEQQQDLENEK